jgi:hypothetical protein
MERVGVLTNSVGFCAMQKADVWRAVHAWTYAALLHEKEPARSARASLKLRGTGRSEQTLCGQALHRPRPAASRRDGLRELTTGLSQDKRQHDVLTGSVSRILWDAEG